MPVGKFNFAQIELQLFMWKPNGYMQDAAGWEDCCRCLLEFWLAGCVYVCVCWEWKLVESIESGKINEQITKSWEPINLGVGGGKQVSKKETKKKEGVRNRGI